MNRSIRWRIAVPYVVLILFLMALVDFILNVAGLLLWFSWRTPRFDPPARSAPTLAGTRNRAATFRLLRWLSVVALIGLVCGRAFFYRLLGPAVDWTAGLNIGTITLFFRSDQFWLMFFFSVLSFLRALVLVYFWLFCFCIVNRNTPEPDSILRWIRHQLGRLAKWPATVQLALPIVFVSAVWPGLHALLSYASITSPLPLSGRLILQGALIGIGIYFSVKFLIPLVLFADWLASYIYFGSGPIWNFLDATSHNLLTPLRRLPLRVGKVDCAPLVGIVATLLLLHFLPRLVLFELNRRNLTLWPQ